MANNDRQQRTEQPQVGGAHGNPGFKDDLGGGLGQGATRGDIGVREGGSDLNDLTSSNIVEGGQPGDLSAAATDEMGGGSDDGADDIAADDAGTGGLEGNTGRTAGGDVALGVGGQSGPSVDAPSGAASIAADDAGASRAAAAVPANGSGAD